VLDVCWALGKCENIHVVNLVFPGWYDPDPVEEAAMQKFMEQVQKLRKTGSKGLKIQLVRVSRTEVIEGSLTVFQGRQWRFMHECRGEEDGR
jgi:hypothetical protein